MTEDEIFKKTTRNLIKRLEKQEKAWLILNKILDKQDDWLEKHLQKTDEKTQRRKVKGRLLSHNFEDLDLDDWK